MQGTAALQAPRESWGGRGRGGGYGRQCLAGGCRLKPRGGGTGGGVAEKEGEPSKNIKGIVS